MIATPSSTQELRHSLGPTVTYVIMGAIAQCLMIAFYLKHLDTGFLIIGGIFWLFVAYKIASFRLYRVKFNDNSVSKRPFGSFKWETLPFGSITRIKIRGFSPDLKGRSSQLPTSRIEFYAKSSDPFAVSLTHFQHPDIRALLNQLRSARPDLEMPFIR